MKKKDHIIVIGFMKALLKRLDFERYRISFIIGADHETQLTSLEKSVATVRILPFSLTPYSGFDQNFEQIIRFADECVELHGTPVAIIGVQEETVYPAALLRDAFGVQGMNGDVALGLRDKAEMKARLLAHGKVKIPRFKEYLGADSLNAVTDYFSDQDYPLIVKPRREAASKGICKVASKSELIETLKGSGEAPDLEVEVFCDSDTVHIDGVIRDGKLLFLSANRFISTCLEWELHDIPLASVLIPSLQEYPQLLPFTIDVLSGLKVDNSVFHLEAFVHHDKSFTFLEIAGRFGGCCIFESLESWFGVDLILESVKVCLNEPCSLQSAGLLKRQQAIHAAWLMMPIMQKERCRVLSLKGLDRLPGTIVCSGFPSLAEILNDKQTNYGWSGWFVLQSTSQEALLKEVRQVMESFAIETEAAPSIFIKQTACPIVMGKIELSALQQRPILISQNMKACLVVYEKQKIDKLAPRYSEQLHDLHDYAISGFNFYNSPYNPPYFLTVPGSIPYLLSRKSVAEKIVVR